MFKYFSVLPVPRFPKSRLWLILKWGVFPRIACFLNSDMNWCPQRSSGLMPNTQ